jgi:hypothetical protein
LPTCCRDTSSKLVFQNSKTEKASAFLIPYYRKSVSEIKDFYVRESSKCDARMIAS